MTFALAQTRRITASSASRICSPVAGSKSVRVRARVLLVYESEWVVAPLTARPWANGMSEVT
ncbi:hypothetical protein J8F10_03790 [Gemmata sp. G18]|uniref:Uncharacterized protein n=1 Tax=Gemmata palustris TaxID=2822762 RepID=A0ABS5BL28_9BACT|nr:hypothetical protein [Gemmata palustris]MBP3954412.1 hypothetical protein [Gemmata palustris]